MVGLYILGGIVSLAFVWTSIRFFLKRVICAYKINRICRKKGHKIYATHLLWFFGGKHTKKCDLYIETANEVFAIKLFGVRRKLSRLIIKETGEYLIQSYVPLISYGAGFHVPINSKSMKMPQYNFRYMYKDEWEIKKPRRVLLVNPVLMEFKRQPCHGGEVTVGAGEIVNGMEIDSLPRLLGDLESAL